MSQVHSPVSFLSRIMRKTQISMRKKREMASCWLNILSKKLTAYILFLGAVKMNLNIKGLCWSLGYVLLLMRVRWSTVRKMEFKKKFYWSTVAVQYCVHFSCTGTWISQMYTYIPSFWDFLPIQITTVHQGQSVARQSLVQCNTTAGEKTQHLCHVSLAT